MRKFWKLYAEKFLFVSGKEDVPRGLHKYLQEPTPGYVNFPKRIQEFRHKWKVCKYLSNNIALLTGTSFNSHRVRLINMLRKFRRYNSWGEGGFVPELNEIVTGLSPRKYALNLRKVREQYVFHEVKLGLFLFRIFRFFPCQLLLHRYSLFILPLSGRQWSH